MATQPVNPFAPPKAAIDFEPGLRRDDRTGGPWRDDKLCITVNNAVFPSRCVKCNAPIAGNLPRRDVYWHSPYLYVLLLMNAIIYIVVAMSVRKRATISYGVCDAHAARRRNGMLIGWLGSLGCLGLAIASASQDTPVLLPLAVLGFLGCIIAGIVLSRLLLAVRIADGYVRLSGAGPEFLASLDRYV